MLIHFSFRSIILEVLEFKKLLVEVKNSDKLVIKNYQIHCVKYYGTLVEVLNHKARQEVLLSKIPKNPQNFGKNPKFFPKNP